MFNFLNISNWLSEMLVGSSGGKYVTPEEAIKYPPIWYAVNKIAGHVGQLPLICYRKTADGNIQPATDTCHTACFELHQTHGKRQ